MPTFVESIETARRFFTLLAAPAVEPAASVDWRFTLNVPYTVTAGALAGAGFAAGAGAGSAAGGAAGAGSGAGCAMATSGRDTATTAMSFFRDVMQVLRRRVLLARVCPG